MRIEAFLQQGLPSIQQEQIPSYPQAGDVIRAAVLSQDNGNVMLKVEDGRVFQASLASEAMLLPNDNAELLVVDSSPEKLVLRLVFVEPGTAPFAEKAAFAEGAARRDMTELIAAFIGKEGRPTAQTLASAQQAMREYGVDAQTAGFFAANGIEVTAESLWALRQFAQGNTAGKAIAEAAQSIPPSPAQAGVQPPAAVGGERPFLETNSVQSGGLPVHSEDSLQESVSVRLNGADSDPLPSARLGDGRQPLIREAGGEGAPQQQKLSAKAAGKANDQLGGSTSADVRANNRLTEISGGKLSHSNRQRGVVGQDGGARNAGDIKTEISEEMELAGEKAVRPESRLSAGALREKMLSLFLHADDGLDGQAVKAAVTDVKNQLALLQEIAKHTDTSDKQNITVRLNDARAQMQLTEDISRFLCIQIPVHLKGYETAELYVYKRNRKGGKIDPENTSIVLGISTESLGRVEALLRVENRTISLSFGVENAAMIPAFRAESAELKKALSDLRYSLTEYRVCGLSEPTTPLNAEEKLLASVKRRHACSLEYMV